MNDEHEGDDEPLFTEPPVDRFPGISGNLTGTPGGHELRRVPRARSWPLLIAPLVLALIVGGGILLFR